MNSEIQSSNIPDKVVEIRNLEIPDMHNWVMCPISYNIFLNPVIAADGHVYEHDCIFRWFDECSKKHSGRISPLTKAMLYSNDLTPCHVMRQMVNSYLALYPEKKELQYKSEFNMNIWLYYIYHTEAVKEQYIRNIESINISDITFHDFTKYVETNFREEPCLSIHLWTVFFNKITDLHADFKLDDYTRHLMFEDEEEDFDVVILENQQLENMPDSELEQTVINLESRLNQIESERMENHIVGNHIDIPEWEEEEGEIVEFREAHREENVPSISFSITRLDDPFDDIVSNTMDVPLTLEDLETVVNEETAIEIETTGDATEAAVGGESNLDLNSGEDTDSDSESESESSGTSETSETSEEEGEEEREEGEVEEEEEPEIRVKETKTKLKKEQNNLLTSICLYGHIKVLEIFLKIMPAITCPEIAEKYKYLLEDFITIRNIKKTMRIADVNEIERFERVIHLMIEKGIPYNNWTRDGSMPILVMIFMTINGKNYPFTHLNMTLVQKPEFFVFPTGASSGSLTPKKVLKNILSNTISLYAGVHILEQYAKHHAIDTDDVLDLCVKYSSHNIWVSNEWNTEPNIEKLMLQLVKSRGSIPMELILLNSFSPKLIRNCFDEGYNIENVEQTYTFPRHRDILPPFMIEDVLFPKINKNIAKETAGKDCVLQDGLENQSNPNPKNLSSEQIEKLLQRLEMTSTSSQYTQTKKKWKELSTSIVWKRIEYSRENGTEWTWDGLVPVMSVLGWLIYMYEPDIVLKFIENNKEQKLNMNSQDFTGLDTLNPIHLAVKYYNESDSAMELLDEIMRQGASLEQKTSHGWYPIHYACRYSPKLIDWMIITSENRERCVNMPLYFYPSCNTLKILKQKLEWYQTWLPLNIFILNHCETYNDSMIKIMNTMIDYGAKRTMEEMKEKRDKDDSVFVYDGPIGFNIGTSVINTVHRKEETKNIKKRKHRHV